MKLIITILLIISTSIFAQNEKIPSEILPEECIKLLIKIPSSEKANFKENKDKILAAIKQQNSEMFLVTKEEERKLQNNQSISDLTLINEKLNKFYEDGRIIPRIIEEFKALYESDSKSLNNAQLECLSRILTQIYNAQKNNI